MNRKKTATILSGVLVISITMYLQPAIATENCIRFAAEMKTKIISPTQQRGYIQLDFGHTQLKGAINGTIDEQGNGYAVLHHLLSFEPLGSILTNEDRAQLTYVDGCQFNVYEDVNIVEGTGVFKQLTRSAAIANGTINMCTLQNQFIVEGELCFADDSLIIDWPGLEWPINFNIPNIGLPFNIQLPTQIIFP